MRHAHIPYQKVTDMHLWQLCHLAMVVPIADAYYESDDPEKVEKEWKIMRKTAERLKRNFNFLRKQKGKLMCTQCQGHLVFYFPNIWTLSFMEFQDSYNEFCRIKKFVQ